MTKKDFEVLAAALSQVSDVRQRRAIAYTMAIYLEHTYPRFKTARFIEACGLQARDPLEDRP